MCRMVHGVWDSQQSGQRGLGVWHLRVSVSLVRLPVPGGRRLPPWVLRGSPIPHLPASQGLWDAVLSKKTFF